MNDKTDMVLHLIDKVNQINEIHWEDWSLSGYRLDHYRKDIANFNLYVAILSKDKHTINLPHFNHIDIFPALTFKKEDLYCLVFVKGELVRALQETFMTG